MRAADRALYAAKDLGKDRTAIYSPEVARVLARASGSQGGDLQLAPLMSLAEALDVRDTGNAVHSRTVGRYARITAVELGLTPSAWSACAWPACSTTWARSACRIPCS